MRLIDADSLLANMDKGMQGAAREYLKFYQMAVNDEPTASKVELPGSVGGALFRGKRKDNGQWTEGNLITDEMEPSRAFIGYLFGVDDDGTVHDMDVVEVYPDTVFPYSSPPHRNRKGSLMIGDDILESLDNAWKAMAVQYNNCPNDGIRCGMNLLAKIIEEVHAEARRDAKIGKAGENRQITLEEWLAVLGAGNQGKTGRRGVSKTE